MNSHARDRWYAVLVTVIVLALIGAVMVWQQRPTDPLARAVGEPSVTEPEYHLRWTTFVTFTADGHGYGFWSECFDPDREICETWLAATDDGGASWARRDLPRVSVSAKWASWGLYVLGGDRVVVQLEGSGPNNGYTPPRRWFSADAGWTWQERYLVPSSTVDEIPPGGLLIYEGVSLSWPPATKTPYSSPVDSEIRAHVLQPDGKAAFLRHPPSDPSGVPLDVIVPDNPAPPAGDGSTWVVGYALVGMEWVKRVLVSRDRGRTWQAVLSFTTPNLLASLYTANAQSAYLVSYDGGSDDRVRHSADGGATWTDLRLPAGLAGAFRNYDSRYFGLVAFVGGRLLALAGSKLYGTTLDGTAFEEVRGAPPMSAIRGAGAKAIGRPAGTHPLGTYVSDDGVTWRLTRLP